VDQDAYARFGETMSLRYEAWEAALDRIELDVIRTERALASPDAVVRTDEWTVPDDYGPIPVALRPRAEELLARQQELLARLGERLGATAQHRALVEDVDALSGRSSTQAVYVDVAM
jgi:hypothetical protein